VTRIQYLPLRLGARTLAVVAQANEIIAEYEAQGFTLTLRQLYYQFVARDLIPNTMRSYKRLGSIVNDGRLAGLIDWEALEDRTRWLRELSHWEGPSAIVAACAEQFRVDRWAEQKYRPEVWIEKDALAGVIEGVCEELDVPFFPCRGYVSQSEQWRAGLRHARHRKNGQTPLVFHLGDHDPSGVDMTRDNASRLRMFAGGRVEFRRLALNMDQIEQYDPPPNPAKITDSRAEGYIAEHGESSWELDALEPRVLVALVRDNVEALIDRAEWRRSERAQERGRARLHTAAERLAEEDA
jgi:hypothetical protein